MDYIIKGNVRKDRTPALQSQHLLTDVSVTPNSKYNIINFLNYLTPSSITWPAHLENSHLNVSFLFAFSQAHHSLRLSPLPLNMNHYANKKSAAESMLDVALLMANASQLKAVLEQGPNFSFYNPLITLISLSLCLQVLVGILLIFIGEREHTNTHTYTQRTAHLYVSLLLT